VWNAVDAHARKAHTSIIHGKWAHEETIATASFATTFLVVKNLKEASFVCDYIVHGGSKADFFARFDPQAMSAGFDPDVDLQRVGIANQTTMLKGETEAIGKLFQQAVMERWGVGELNQHFMLLDTICDATQERQDAMYELVQAKPDVMLVVGGFNSSNTSHLQEISEEAGVVSFWVDTAERVGPGNVIQHRTAHGELVTTRGWLPEGKVVLGVTSGASTPDKVVEDVLDAVFAIKEGAKQAVAA
jgi:4-hydroxy-3-methylbut-2-enyl diphosphate reductase